QQARRRAMRWRRASSRHECARLSRPHGPAPGPYRSCRLPLVIAQRPVRRHGGRRDPHSRGRRSRAREIEIDGRIAKSLRSKRLEQIARCLIWLKSINEQRDLLNDEAAGGPHAALNTKAIATPIRHHDGRIALGLSPRSRDGVFAWVTRRFWTF